MRLIDADELTKTLAIVAKKMEKSDAQQALMGRVFYILEHRHEEVVRCRDCKHSVAPSKLTKIYGQKGTLTCHYGPCNRRNINEADFCSYGERREDKE